VVEASLSLIALKALPAVIVGGTVAFFTWNAQRAARALLLSELLLALVAMAVLPAHGAEGNWINPVGHTRLIYDGVKAGRTYDDALKDTQPIMQRELEADSYECVAQWMDTRTKTLNQGMAEACMSARGWMRVSTPKQMADAYHRAWQAEVDRHDGVDPGIIVGR
jgi:hypothetical protein